MYSVRLICWEVMKALTLAFLGLLAAKGVSSFAAERQAKRGKHLALTTALYLITLALVVLGARAIGYNLAAEVYRWTSDRNLSQSQMEQAYSNAMRAVALRPGVIANWRTLARTKIALHQFESLLDDASAFRSLTGGDLDEEDAYNFSVCYFYLGQYDKLILATERLIQRNRSYAAPYVLQGLAYSALGKHAEAEWSFLAVLQIFPTNQAALEGLAHDYFLAGNRRRALELLDESAKFRFPPEARARFENLKRLYAQ